MLHYTKCKSSFWLLVGLISMLPACWPWGTRSLKTGLLIVNVLDKELYDDCHIPGSINVPFQEIPALVDEVDKEQADIVLYCSNWLCTASHSAAHLLRERGCKHVSVYSGGMAEWYQKGFAYKGSANQEYLKHIVPEPANMHNADTITAQQLQQKIDGIMRTDAAA
jgi:rhodanese-related sulfurtransferase